MNTYTSTICSHLYLQYLSLNNIPIYPPTFGFGIGLTGGFGTSGNVMFHASHGL